MITVVQLEAEAPVDDVFIADSADYSGLGVVGVRVPELFLESKAAELLEADLPSLSLFDFEELLIVLGADIFLP